MNILNVSGLTKKYPSFLLDNVSFELKQGRIIGFIGRNGAGKSTTLKSLLNLVHPDAGTVTFFGEDFEKNELEIKQRIGFVSGSFDFYTKKKIKTITNVTKKFYHNWDEASYEKYMKIFKLNENKTPYQLSEGMKVKYSLVLALSHKAELLILDEPTSGLDPVSREDLLDIFIQLVEKENVTILFSTHITTDLEKCADDIIYIKEGKIIAESTIEQFLSEYKVVRFDKEQIIDTIKDKLIGLKREKFGYSALIKANQLPIQEAATIDEATLDAIMVHFEKEEI